MSVANSTIAISLMDQHDATRRCLDHLLSIINHRETHTISLPSVVKAVAFRVQRAARAVRSAVRQSFASRIATKAADGGGGDPDPDGRRPHTETYISNSHSPVSAFLFGGAK